MIEIKELDQKTWTKGFAFSVTTEKRYNATRLDSEISLKSSMYSYLLDYKKNHNSIVLEVITEEIYESEFLRNEFLKSCVIVPVPSLKRGGIVREIAESIGKKFGITVATEEAFTSVYMDETVSLEKYLTRNRLHPTEYLVNKDYFESMVPKETRIVVFDDIYDTGSTVQAVAKAFSEAGIENVDVFALCVTQEAFIRIELIKKNWHINV